MRRPTITEAASMCLAVALLLAIVSTGPVASGATSSRSRVPRSPSVSPSTAPAPRTGRASGMTLAGAPSALRAAVRATLGTPAPSNGPSHQQAKLTASDGAGGDDFGDSVAIAGSTAVVGANGRNGQAGAAYVFVRSNGTWSQQAELTPTHPAPGDAFGSSVALSGSTVVVGADGAKSLSGAAYVFTRSNGTWSQQAKLVASDGAAYDEFGVSVAVYGSTAVVGAYQHRAARGAAYVFIRSNGTWSQQAELTASDSTKNSSFGYAVGLSHSTAVVGAFAHDAFVGAAYVFVRSGSTWSEQAKLTASDGAADDYFGASVTISDGTALVAAPNKDNQMGAAYVFVRSKSKWSQQAKLTASDGAAFANFGSSVALSGDTAVLGASGTESYTGVAYVFVRSDTTWSQQAEIAASDGAAFDNFGCAAAISGSTALFGAVYANSDAGAAYVFVSPW